MTTARFVVTAARRTAPARPADAGPPASAASRLAESAGPRRAGPTDPRPTEPAGRRTAEPADPRPPEPTDPRTAEPTDPRTAKPGDPRTAKPAEPRTAEPGAPRAIETTDLRATEAASPYLTAPAHQSSAATRLWTEAENRRTPRLHSDPPSARGGGGGGGRDADQDPLGSAAVPRGPAGHGLPVLRIAVWQVALVLGFAAVGRDLGAGIGLGTAAAVTLAISAGRVRGEWLSTVALRWAGFVARRRQWDSEHVPLPRDAAITSAGVLVWAEGMTAVTRTSAFGFPKIEADGPRLDLQLVAHLGPRQARPSAWLAITARRDADNATDDQLHVPLDNAIRRLRKAAPREFALLSGREVRAAVGGVAHAGPARETWRYWCSGPITQITLRLTGLPGPSFIDRLLTEGRAPGRDRLLTEDRAPGKDRTLTEDRTPGKEPGKPGEPGELGEPGMRPKPQSQDAAVTVAVRPDGQGVVRVAATSADAAERAVTRITRICAPHGVRLERLDGRHGPAVLASLPIGGEL